MFVCIVGSSAWLLPLPPYIFKEVRVRGQKGLSTRNAIILALDKPQCGKF